MIDRGRLFFVYGQLIGKKGRGVKYIDIDSVIETVKRTIDEIDEE